MDLVCAFRACLGQPYLYYFILMLKFCFTYTISLLGDHITHISWEQLKPSANLFAHVQLSGLNWGAVAGQDLFPKRKRIFCRKGQDFAPKPWGPLLTSRYFQKIPAAPSWILTLGLNWVCNIMTPLPCHWSTQIKSDFFSKVGLVLVSNFRKN